MSNNLQQIKGDETRQRVLDAISTHWEINGYAPSHRDICKLTGIASTSTIHYHLNWLEIEGRIERKHKVSRSIRVIEGVNNE